jgi:hypothetical protein
MRKEAVELLYLTIVKEELFAIKSGVILKQSSFSYPDEKSLFLLRKFSTRLTDDINFSSEVAAIIGRCSSLD